MWSKTFKPGGEVKVKRDVAMSEQAELILKKKAQIEARWRGTAKLVQRPRR